MDLSARRLASPRETGEASGARLGERIFPRFPDVLGQKGQPRHSERGILRHAKGMTARLVHVHERAVERDQLDAVDADVEHVGLDERVFFQSDLAALPDIDIGADTEPERVGKRCAGDGLQAELKPANASAGVLKTAFEVETKPGQRAGPERRLHRRPILGMNQPGQGPRRGSRIFGCEIVPPGGIEVNDVAGGVEKTGG